MEVLLADPTPEDMFHLSLEPVQQIYAEYERFLADILRQPLEQSGLDVREEELAHVISFSIKGFKATAHDVRSLRQMIETQNAVIVAALVPRSSAAKARKTTPVRKARTAKR